jgi:multiple sugar transport system permease protein
VLLPYIVPTALSALAFWWIYDTQFSVVSWGLMRLGLIDHYIDFLGEPWLARASVIVANVWRGVPFIAICLLAGLQTIPVSLQEAASLDGATPWKRFRYVTLPMLTPIIAVVMTFSVLFTFTDFQLIYVLTKGGPVNATHLMAAFHGMATGKVPQWCLFLLASILLASSAAAPGLAAWESRHGTSKPGQTADAAAWAT